MKGGKIRTPGGGMERSERNKNGGEKKRGGLPMCRMPKRGVMRPRNVARVSVSKRLQSGVAGEAQKPRMPDEKMFLREAT